ncbi:electron transfer flavoprotein subunit beta/FixA family protein [Corynebacterium endometrii]|uniref:Electron transfer flavoprotein subunit beta n=1 Tax=Corynebacterium endometrii TaxID=2488819 RepID=A0A4P7QFF7_9CORY|nr:electron transfer flavoprotein subunit beta/FixA family protein [Corynebacterium endometrii]QCB28263.1 Electron transfer flavoprotein subunit beta [Corynebacterium endometrii]
MPSIVALVKYVPDTWSSKNLNADNRLDRESVDNVIDEINEYSVEQALRLRDDNPDAGFKVVALTMGPAAADEALRKALAMGADEAVHVSDDALAGTDALGTAWALSNALNSIEDVQLVVMGNYASDSSTGLLTGLLAEYRQVPALSNVKSIALAGDVIKGVREDSRGNWELEAKLPAIVSVTDKTDKPRFPNFKGLMAAKKAEVTKLDLAAIGVDPAQVGGAAATTQVTASEQRPARTAGEVISGVSAEEAAKKVADYLEAKNLI